MYAAVDNRGVSLCFNNTYVWAHSNPKKALSLSFRDRKRAKLAMISGWNTNLLEKPLFITLQHNETVFVTYPHMAGEEVKS